MSTHHKHYYRTMLRTKRLKMIYILCINSMDNANNILRNRNHRYGFMVQPITPLFVYIIEFQMVWITCSVVTFQLMWVYLSSFANLMGPMCLSYLLQPIHLVMLLNYFLLLCVSPQMCPLLISSFPFVP